MSRPLSLWLHSPCANLCYPHRFFLVLFLVKSLSLSLSVSMSLSLTHAHTHLFLLAYFPPNRLATLPLSVFHGLTFLGALTANWSKGTTQSGNRDPARDGGKENPSEEEGGRSGGIVAAAVHSKLLPLFNLSLSALKGKVVYGCRSTTN